MERSGDNFKMPKRAAPAWKRYGVAILSVLVAVLVRYGLALALGESYPFGTIFLAIAFSAWYGGFGPALTTAALALAFAIFIPSGRGAGANRDQILLGLLVYAMLSLVLASLGGLMARARRRIADSTEEILRQREQLRATLSSIGDAVIVTNKEGRISSLNTVAEQLTGWKSAEAAGHPLGEVFRIVNEATRQEVESPVARVLREGAVLGLANHTILISKDGTERPIDDSAAPILDAAGRLAGVVLVFRDVAERRKNEIEGRAATERLRLALTAGQMGVWEWDVASGRVTFTNHMEAIHGLAAGSFGGTLDAFLKLIYPDDRGRIMRSMSRAVEEGIAFDTEFRTVWPDGNVRWIAGKGTAHVGQGGAKRMIGVALDVTDRKRSQQTAQFLVDASEVLGSLVNLESTLEKVAHLAVPFFADWCLVDLLDNDGKLRRMAMAHVESQKQNLAREIFKRWPDGPGSPEGPEQVMHSGCSQLVPEITDEMLTHTIHDPELLSIVRKLGLRSYIGVPLSVRGKVIGVLTFLSAESGRQYTVADLAAAEDLAHRAAVAVENAQLYQAVREADRRKDEFLAVLAHELRNPLAPIGSALQILKLPNTDAVTASEARDVAERQLSHLTRLVDDLLDVSRIMRGKTELRKERVELATIVAQAVETARPLIAACSHELSVSLPEEPVWLDADQVRLAQVLSNLLSNAAKYTEAGGHIWLTGRLDDGEALVCVRDSGIGIDSDTLPRLFEMFMQVSPGATRSQGGLGIGLTLVKNLIEMHGGSVAAHSAGLGEGSEFVVRLPLATSEAQVAAEPTGASSSSHDSHRILVVDDNVDAARSLALLLRLHGHAVEMAHSGREALASAKAQPPELVFLDIGMPEMDGYEVARRLRAEINSNLMLVALTGWGTDEDRRRSHEAGFDHHLTKPVDLSSLMAVVARAVPAAESRSQTRDVELQLD